MTRDDMIRMAHQAGWQYADGDGGYEGLWAFGALVAAHEREACAELADAEAEESVDCCYSLAVRVAKAIRARGQDTNLYVKETK